MATANLVPNGTVKIVMYSLGPYTNLDDIPYDDTDYVYASGIGCAGYYSYTDMPEYGIILGATIYFRCWKVGPDPGYASAGFWIDDNLYSPNTVYPTTTPTTYSNSSSNNPKTGVAWTYNDINSIATKLSMAGTWGTTTTTVYCSQIYIQVNYTPSAPQSYFIPKIMKHKSIP
jgi:hypothetical protein